MTTSKVSTWQELTSILNQKHYRSIKIQGSFKPSLTHRTTAVENLHLLLKLLCFSFRSPYDELLIPVGFFHSDKRHKIPTKTFPINQRTLFDSVCDFGGIRVHHYSDTHAKEFFHLAEITSGTFDRWTGGWKTLVSSLMLPRRHFFSIPHPHHKAREGIHQMTKPGVKTH